MKVYLVYGVENLNTDFNQIEFNRYFLVLLISDNHFILKCIEANPMYNSI